MSSSIVWGHENNEPPVVEIGAIVDHPRSVRCHLSLIKDSDNLYSAIVLNLPGAGGSGSTPEEAENDAKDSVRSLVESYTISGEQIPWLCPEEYEIEEGASQKWILVDV